MKIMSIVVTVILLFILSFGLSYLLFGLFSLLTLFFSLSGQPLFWALFFNKNELNLIYKAERNFSTLSKIYKEVEKERADRFALRSQKVSKNSDIWAGDTFPLKEEAQECPERSLQIRNLRPFAHPAWINKSISTWTLHRANYKGWDGNLELMHDLSGLRKTGPAVLSFSFRGSPKS
jgi:hypothetical protein